MDFNRHERLYKSLEITVKSRRWVRLASVNIYSFGMKFAVSLVTASRKLFASSQFWSASERVVVGL